MRDEEHEIQRKAQGVPLEDLLLPGVIIDEEKGIKAYGEGTLEKGDTVAVNLQSNRAPVAVGTAWLSSEDITLGHSDFRKIFFSTLATPIPM